MPLIEWGPTYSVKVGEIDQQHQKLITMINELNDAMIKGQGKDIISPIIDGLIIYSQVHFLNEETMFNEHKYPDAVAHKAEHAAFIKKVAGFRDGIKKDSMSLTVNVMNFLSNWLTNHICRTDKKYTDFFNHLGIN